MKNKLFLLGIFALLVSCSYDPDELNDVGIQLAPQIKLEGSISQQYITRVDDGGFCHGDQIGLYGVNYTNDNSTAGTLENAGNQVNNARYTYDGENDAWNSSGSIYYKNAETNIDLYAYYPYGSPESVSDYVFTVAKDQTREGVTDGYAMSDFLWGKVENVTPSDQKVKIKFSHRLSCANVILTEGEGFAEGEWEILQKSVLVSNTIREASIDLATGDAIAAGEVETEGIVMRATEGGYRAIVVPQTVAANTALFTITINGITHKFKKDTDFTYEPGMQSKFTIKVKKKAMTGDYEFTLTDCDIVEWIADIETHGGEARQYYVVHQEKPGTLGELIRADKKNPNKIKNLKISGKIDVRDFHFMRDSMEILQAVNLKESTIEESWIWLAIDNINHIDRTLYFEGEMPTTDTGRQNVLNETYPNLDTNGWGWSDPIKCGANEIPNRAFFTASLVGYWADYKKSLIYFSFPEKVTKIGDYAFSYTSLSGALIIPSDVYEIGKDAFISTNISSLELPHNLKTIKDTAFDNCKYMSGNLHLPESLEYISRWAFRGCIALSGTLHIPSKITEITEYCFSDCGFTGDLIIPDGVTKIGSNAFSDCAKFDGCLHLPQSIKEIGEGAFSGCKFQGELVIPWQIKSITGCFSNNEFSRIVFPENSEVTRIDHSAFANNWRLSEPIILPEELILIGANAFDGCKGIPQIVLPSKLDIIGNGAFAGCSGLTSIISKATTPPMLGEAVFSAVPKDNFTVEVPEQSVVKYQTSNGWSDFRRIAAHCDFSISRSLMRTLNAGVSKTYTLRAPSGFEWSIESKPDWVTITPSNGVGKTEVTISISQLEPTDETFLTSYNDERGDYYGPCEGRAGEIVFLLNGKDYRTKMAIEQYDYEYGDGDVIVNQTASQGNGVNLVFMGDCFDAQDIATGKYLDGINEAIGYYFDIEPYKTYKDYFNIYTIVGMSQDSGVGTVNTVKDAKFGSQYAIDGVYPDINTTFKCAMMAPTVNEGNLNQSLVVMVENTIDYGGVCYMWSDGSAIAVCPMSRDAYPFDFRGIVQHEAGGHGFAKLADEYIYHNNYIGNCNCLCCVHIENFLKVKGWGWYRNLSTNGDIKTVEWSHLIFHPDYSNVVDVYEGGYYHLRGIYRSEATSCMNNNISYYSAIQRQEMVERIKRYAGEEFSLEEFYANDVRDASNNTITRGVATDVLDMSNAGKQMPPKFMGDKPQLK